VSAARGLAPGTPRAVLGIDLGTSHTALAWAHAEPDASPAELLIPQWVAGRRRANLPLLASVLYAPLPGELPVEAGEAPDWVSGEYARIRSQETSGRGIASAKSWLCHGGVDRLGPILPWGVADATDLVKLSPVEVSRRILWDVCQGFSTQHPDLSLAECLVVLTVPASFDQTARQLTVLAAEQAGLRVRLLEEPQAAFYEYSSHASAELTALVRRRGSLRVLVCDIGGGTTDLSLIDVEARGDALGFRRSAVGRHLLLGGDNMDLALARLAERKLGDQALDAGRFGQLLLAARGAKEVLLAQDAPTSFQIRLLESGASLFGSALSVELTAREARQLILEGFFPITARGEGPQLRRSGLTSFGLPYEKDPAVTRHIAQFLTRHTGGRVPEALLLNGGVSRSPVITRQLLACFEAWGAGEVSVLSASDAQLAVSRGAVRYGLSLSGFGPRIEGGTAHGYYVGVEALGGKARQALCVVPRGAKEGERHVLGTRRFELTVGRPARFELYSSDTALHAPGTRVDIDEDFQALPPVTTELRAAGVAGAAQVQVQLEGELSAVGTLELGCTLVTPSGPGGTPAPLGGGPRFSLAFELSADRAGAPSARTPQLGKPSSVSDPSRFVAAEAALLRVFGKGRKDVLAREVKDLIRSLERSLGPRKVWDLEVSRKLCDVVLDGAKARLRSEDHERMFWMLVGQGLRPGFGHPLDAERIQRVWALFEPGLTHREAERSWQQYWIAWRRINAGLLESQQTHVRELLDPVLSPPELKLKKPKGFRPQALDEMLELASHLERVEAGKRAELGRWILERTWSNRDPRLWTHLGRVGARVPTYASAHYALKAASVERWVEQLLRERWHEIPTAAASAVSLARVTGDQVRDLSPGVRGEVADALRRISAPEAWQRAVLEYVPVTQAEREQQLGDDLPLGLRLLQ
jgi:molecular chaperone DnaK (HSP70)